MKYGLGEKSKIKVKDILKAAGAGKEYEDVVGRGLFIAGVNATSMDKEMRIQQGTEKLLILAPELPEIELAVEFDNEPEVDRPIKTPEVQAKKLAEAKANSAAEVK